MALNVLTEDDEYYFNQIRDLDSNFFKGSNYVKININYKSYLKFDDNRELLVGQVSKEFLKKISGEVDTLFTDKHRRIDRYGGNDINWLVNTAYRIENRKSYILELEKLKSDLVAMKTLPNSKSRKKELNWRIKNVNFSINDNRLGTENLLLDLTDWWKFNNRNNRPNNSNVEYMSISSILGFDDKFSDVLNIIESFGVPNVNLLRGLPAQAEETFFSNWKKKDFIPYASAHLLENKADAIEGVIRRVPSGNSCSGFSTVSNPRLENILSDKNVVNKISELGLPVELTSKFFNSWSSASRGDTSFIDEGIGLDFLNGCKDFYFSQLKNHDNPLLKWVAANALIYVHKNKKTWKNKFTHLEDIVSSLNLDEDYPNLAKNRELLKSRLLNNLPYRVKNCDPFDLADLDDLCISESYFQSVLSKYNLNYDVSNFKNEEYLRNLKDTIDETVKILESPEFLGMENNKYFKHFLNTEFNLLNLFSGHSRNKIVDFLGPLKSLSEDLVDFESKSSSEDFAKINKFLFNSIHVDSDILNLYYLYKNTLNKSFNNFIDDFCYVGRDLDYLPRVRDNYSGLLDDDKLKPMLNYVVKKRNKDMIKTLAKSNKTSRDVILSLDSSTSKKDLVKILIESDKTFSLYEDCGAGVRGISKEIKNMKVEGKICTCGSNFRCRCFGVSQSDLITKIKDLRVSLYSDVIGSGNTIPEKFKEEFDNILFAYYKFKNSDGDYRVRSSESEGFNLESSIKLIAQSTAGVDCDFAFKQIQDLDENVKVRNKLESLGVNVSAFENGFTKNYNLETDSNLNKRRSLRLSEEFNVVYDRLKDLDLGFDFSRLEEFDVYSRVSLIEDALKSDSKKSSKRLNLESEIKNHLNSIMSMNGVLKNEKSESLGVDFYVSRSPIESLHMGEYFGSCLSLGKGDVGINGWASVVHTMNSNMNVIYGKDENGNHVVRNRTFLTDSGIFTTRFYQNGNLSVENAWVDYLENLSRDVGVPVYVPKNIINSFMKDKLKNNEIVSASGILLPGAIDESYGDGLNIYRLKNGMMKIDDECYKIV
jgi:hypothetical protein